MVSYLLKQIAYCLASYMIGWAYNLVESDSSARTLIAFMELGASLNADAEKIPDPRLKRG